VRGRSTSKLVHSSDIAQKMSMVGLQSFQPEAMAAGFLSEMAGGINSRCLRRNPAEPCPVDPTLLSI
jgi:hypothetical protein